MQAGNLTIRKFDTTIENNTSKEECVLTETLKKVQKEYLSEKVPAFDAGDTVSVSMKFLEGGKERVQAFQGVVVQRRGAGIGQTVTLRKSSSGVYVERIFPLHSPMITEIKLVKKGRVRRARLYYLRKLTGKATRIKEELN
jgi:large subunit ribosomal protein L19